MIDKEGQSIGILFDTTKAYLTPKEMQEGLLNNFDYQFPIVDTDNLFVTYLSIVNKNISENGNVYDAKIIMYNPLEKIK